MWMVGSRISVQQDIYYYFFQIFDETKQNGAHTKAARYTYGKEMEIDIPCMRNKFTIPI